MKYQIRAMLQNGGGAILNMASIARLQGLSKLGPYVTGAVLWL
jgi:short-subunit dehydrogenase